MLDILKYDETYDVRDHVMDCTTVVKIKEWPHEGRNRISVPKNSISSFAELAYAFIKAHSGSQK